MPTWVLVIAIFVAPIVLGVMTVASGERQILWLVFGSIPILIGVIAQRLKGRTGAAWWFLGVVVTLFFYLVSAVFFGPSMPEFSDVIVGTSGALLFGALPLLIIVATFPRRKVADGVAHTSRSAALAGGIVALFGAVFLGARGQLTVALPLGLTGLGLLGWVVCKHHYYRERTVDDWWH